jgi:hypothetical protein
MSSILLSNAFAGVTDVLNITTFLETDLTDVRNDLEGEQELMPDITKEDAQPIPEEEEDARAFPGGLEELRKIVQNASKGVTEDTDKQYRKQVALLHHVCSCKWACG